jgi:hypothetical protein
MPGALHSQAADLPTKAQPVEYVKACSLYGAGFWYVPGTDTCIKIGAFARLQLGYGAAPATRSAPGPCGTRCRISISVSICRGFI